MGWLGPLLTFVAFVSYFLVFARFPATRDVPWISLPLIILGFVLTVLGLRKNWASAGRWSRLFQSTGVVVSFFFLALFLAYVFVISYQVPEPTPQTLALKQAPGFELTDANGQTVRLDDYRGKLVVLTFYRGHW
mgnify:CR=1 FL=1|tara:strand:- start:8862 stop:9263 length:402 start_codon:yes stop_codon:yes gene_type:complete